MKFKNILFLLTLFTVISCGQLHKSNITDLIKPVNLKEGKTTRLVLNDLFYAENYNVDFLPNENFKVLLDTNQNIIEITSLNNFSGLDLISFKFDGTTYELPVKLAQQKKYLFKYMPSGTPQSVNLFGQFNGWNRENLPMNDDDDDGVYEITIPLDPGRYEYKFYVDGEELIDPENPVNVPNGMGDFNSVRIIEKTVADNQYLHLLNRKVKDNIYSYNFYYESLTRDFITPKDIIALIDNYKIPPQKINLDGNNISLSFSNSELEGSKVIRVAISKNGKHTNFQTVQLEDGTPIGNASNKTWYDAIIYSLLVDRYYDGDTTNSIPVEHPDLSYKANYQGGDLRGLINKLEEGYFDSLGINTFWISPIIDNTENAFKEYPPPHRFFTGYHGYWPVSPNKVEEHFGDMNLAKKFVETAHKHGIKVLIDYIANHVHIEHPFWKKHRNWFGVLDLPNGKKNLRLWDEQRLTTWFEPYLPSFDYVGSKDALDVMTDNAIWWLEETGADGFRHDAVKHVPNEFWRTLTRKIKEQIEIPTGKKVYQIGETFGSFDLISSYVNNGQLSSQFNFNLYDVALPVFLYEDNSFELLDLQMQKTFSVYGVNHLMGNLVDSHDKVRYMAYADSDIELNSNLAKEIGWTNPPRVDHKSSYKKLQLHLAYILTIPGVPVIYYGDEIGMTGAADPDNRRMMRFDDLNNSEMETKTEVSNLIKIRREHSALRYGDFLTLFANKNCYAYIRSDMNERVLVVLNKSSETQLLNLDIPNVYNVESCVNISTGNVIKIKNGNLSVNVPPIGWNIFILK